MTPRGVDGVPAFTAGAARPHLVPGTCPAGPSSCGPPAVPKYATLHRHDEKLDTPRCLSVNFTEPNMSRFTVNK